MFKQRLLTTLILIPLILLTILYVPQWLLITLLLLIMSIASYEWSKFIPLDKPLHIFSYCVLTLIFACISYYGLPIWLYLGMIAWFFVLIAIIYYPKSKLYWGFGSVIACAGCLFLPLFFSSFLGIMSTYKGKALILYLLSLVSMADIGAYLVGKRFGQNKLIAKVSPGKTIEGLIGGISLSLLVAMLSVTFFKPLNLMMWYGTALFITLISIVGDLFISMLKRRCSLKDSGNILPGHGGLLDRIDSSLAAFPFFLFALTFLGLGH